MPSIKLINILFRRWFSSQGFHEGEEIDTDLDETDLPEIPYFNKAHISQSVFFFYLYGFFFFFLLHLALKTLFSVFGDRISNTGIMCRSKSALIS